jgi:hypothetical protein
MSNAAVKAGRTCFPVIAILIAVLASHAGSKLVFTWKNANYTGGSFKNVFVLAINGSATARADFEDRMVKEMSRPGVTVVQSYTLMPRPNATPINLNDLRGYVHDLKFDSGRIADSQEQGPDENSCSDDPGRH